MQDYSVKRIMEFITKHDLTYNYSDDPSARKEGAAQDDLIRNAIDQLDLRKASHREAKKILIDHWNQEVENKLIEDAWPQFKWEK